MNTRLATIFAVSDAVRCYANRIQTKSEVAAIWIILHWWRQWCHHLIEGILADARHSCPIYRSQKLDHIN